MSQNEPAAYVMQDEDDVPLLRKEGRVEGPQPAVGVPPPRAPKQPKKSEPKRPEEPKQSKPVEKRPIKQQKTVLVVNKVSVVGMMDQIAKKAGYKPIKVIRMINALAQVVKEDHGGEMSAPGWRGEGGDGDIGGAAGGGDVAPAFPVAPSPSPHSPSRQPRGDSEGNAARLHR